MAVRERPWGPRRCAGAFFGRREARRRPERHACEANADPRGWGGSWAGARACDYRTAPYAPVIGGTIRDLPRGRPVSLDAQKCPSRSGGSQERHISAETCQSTFRRRRRFRGREIQARRARAFRAVPLMARGEKTTSNTFSPGWYQIWDSGGGSRVTPIVCSERQE